MFRQIQKCSLELLADEVPQQVQKNGFCSPIWHDNEACHCCGKLLQFSTRPRIVFPFVWRAMVFLLISFRNGVLSSIPSTPRCSRFSIQSSAFSWVNTSLLHSMFILSHLHRTRLRPRDLKMMLVVNCLGLYITLS